MAVGAEHEPPGHDGAAILVDAIAVTRDDPEVERLFGLQAIISAFNADNPTAVMKPSHERTQCL